GFKVDEDLERSLDTMCNLSVGIREEGRCEGKIEGKIEGKLEGRLEGMINGIRKMVESFFMLHVKKEECIQIVTEKYPSIE
ncbi:MAG: hypothetical protein KBT48_08240, partial [Firmicutes bacterium]|nr:hypothetical protein [Bacillota bacterium]